MTPVRSTLLNALWWIQQLWARFIELLRTYPGDGDLSSTFCLTISDGKGWNDNLIEDASEACHIADALAFSETRPPGERHYAASCNRGFFATKKSYMSIGLACMKVRDAVCILSGASVPFIPWKRGKDHLPAREAYVHGIMYGEALENSDVETTSLTESRILWGLSGVVSDSMGGIADVEAQRVSLSAICGIPVIEITG
ncbi:hypothetical protein MPH_06588 [Macrophomina phaseolina MS6]|uniref:Uncharacterized protein n=1 Tax=Macrophomina phaseolina (strain MS6) TaxID=1126212 RepID=K2R1Q7_MACPH|nr:hypothetical protein MPH_06588 [Macrophomina phaseolina MS6]